MMLQPDTQHNLERRWELPCVTISGTMTPPSEGKEDCTAHPAMKWNTTNNKQKTICI